MKINRACRLSKIGEYGASFDAMLEHISDDMISAMTARQIASIIDALWACSAKGKEIAELETVNNGFIWDARQCRFRNIAP